MADTILSVNRAPVLALWAAVVAERLGHDEDAALSLGQAVAVLNAQSKGRRLGVFARKEEAEEAPQDRREREPRVEVCGRAVPVRETDQGLRAVLGGETLRPDAVRKYLTRAFGTELTRVRSAMKALAESREAVELAKEAYPLYERFRPAVPEGRGGWGAKGELDLTRIRRMARRPRARPAKG